MSKLRRTEHAERGPLRPRSSGQAARRRPGRPGGGECGHPRPARDPQTPIRRRGQAPTRRRSDPLARPATSTESAARGGRSPGRPRTRDRPVTAVYVSPGVKQRFEAYRHKHKATNLQVVLEAISSKHDELAR